MSVRKYVGQIAYCGGAYSGWQRQKEGLGVQEILEGALSRLSSEPVRVIGAGRTDKGVHAVGQMASFRMPRVWAPERLQLAVNFYLPEDVRVMAVHPVSEAFNARRSALWREYRYFIWHGWVCPPHLNGLVWWRKVPWAIERAREACRVLEGEHDFRAFCKTGECPERSVRTLSRVRCRRWGPMTVLSVRAPSFLMNMVRILVGNVDAVATGKRPLEWLKALLAGDERSHSAVTAPACGLYFWRVGYRELFGGRGSPAGGTAGFWGLPAGDADFEVE